MNSSAREHTSGQWRPRTGWAAGLPNCYRNTIERTRYLQVNVKNRLLVALLGLVAVLDVACTGNGGPTPTRTPRAEALNNPTQTPWIIYVPVTTTPDPFTVTPLPTVTSSAPVPPTAQQTRTRAPQPTAKPVQPTPIPANSPTAAPPSATPAPACGPYTINAASLWPDNPTTRSTKENPGGNMGIEFKFDAVVPYPLDPKIGYRLAIGKVGANGSVRYISHNTFLQAGKISLDPHSVYFLTSPLGSDTNVNWTITPVMSSNGFDDNTLAALGLVTECGPATPPRTIVLSVQ